jgi:hypothetical protein
MVYVPSLQVLSYLNIYEDYQSVYGSTFVLFLDSSISKVMAASLNDRDSIPNRVGDSSALHKVQSGFGTYPNSY